MSENLESVVKVKTQPPVLVLIMTNDDSVEEAVVSTEGGLTFCRTKSVREAIFTLMAVYYVADLEYTKAHFQCLGFLQETVLREQYVMAKSNKFKKFMAS